MDDITLTTNNIVQLLKTKNKEIEIPKPFEREIFLFDTHIAGTTYIDDIETIEKALKIDDTLNFFREPNNAYDNNAIVVKTTNNIKIGYIPREDNSVFSRLMDAGKLLFGRITSKRYADDWLLITMKIYLKD